MSDFKFVLLVIIILFILYLLYRYTQNNKSDNKIENLEDIKNNKTLGVYYTDWCGYSRQFIQQLDSGLKNELNKENIEVKLIDCEKDKTMCAKYNIEGFPTLLVHIDDKIIPYNGQRDNNSIINFIKNQ